MVGRLLGEKSQRQRRRRRPRRPRVPAGRSPGGGGSLHVFPVGRVQAPGDHGEHAQEEQHPRRRCARGLRRLAHPAAGRPPGRRPPRRTARRRRPGVTCSKPREARSRRRSCGPSPRTAACALALQLPQRVRHADAREGEVVPAGRLGLVAVVGAQVGVEVVGTGALAGDASARSPSGRAARRRTTPWPASGRARPSWSRRPCRSRTAGCP